MRKNHGIQPGCSYLQLFQFGDFEIVFAFPVAWFQDIVKQLDIDFDLDISETSEEYLEKIEMDLRRQSNEIDLLLDQTIDANKKSILLQQKGIVNKYIIYLLSMFLFCQS